MGFVLYESAGASSRCFLARHAPLAISSPRIVQSSISVSGDRGREDPYQPIVDRAREDRDRRAQREVARRGVLTFGVLQGTIWPPRSNTCFPFAITQHPNPAGLAETFVAPCFAPFLDNTTNLAERQRSPAVTNVPRSVIPPSKSAQLPALSPPSTTHRCVAHTSVPTERCLTVLPYHLSQSWPRTTSRWT